MNTQDRLAEVWTDYLEGEMDERGLAESRELLAADDEHRVDPVFIAGLAEMQ